MASDAAILDATTRVVARLGPLRFTLADVAREVGVTAAALLRRYDSKRALLLAAVARGVADVPRRFAAARAAHASPLAALLAALAETPGAPTTRQETANSLAFLQIDLTDPAFHALTVAYFDAFRDGVEKLLADAKRAGEIRDAHVPTLARAVEVAYNGSLITWAVRGGGRVADTVRGDVGALLEPYRAGR